MGVWVAAAELRRVGVTTNPNGSKCNNNTARFLKLPQKTEQ